MKSPPELCPPQQQGSVAGFAICYLLGSSRVLEALAAEDSKEVG